MKTCTFLIATSIQLLCTLDVVTSTMVKECPEEMIGLPNTAYSPSTGCIWADDNHSQKPENFDDALKICKDVFGPDGQLVEILSKEDDQVVMAFIANVSSVYYQHSKTYWWTGLQDEDLDDVWIWTGSKFMNIFCQIYNIFHRYINICI